jgi:acyl-CoA synthetase (AMP-forming)/AMP-acid ligase II
VTEALKESNVIIPIYSVSPLEEKHHPVHIPLISDDEPALLLYTSGSTGLPKGVLLSEKNLVTNALQVIERTNLTSEDCILHQMPLHHTNGINNNLIAPFLAGAKVVLGPRFHAETLFSLIEIERPTYFTGVPTMYWRLTQQNVPKGALDSLRFVRCGSAPLSTNLETQIEEHLGVPVITSYGLTEGTCTSTMTPLHNKLLGSVGTPLSGQEIRIVDPATMKDVGRNQEGEVMIRGNNLMLGYYKDIEATNKVFHNGWLRTGDLGKLNNQGYLFLSDRIKEIIVRGGENISPREVENVLRSHPSVIDVTVVGVPSQEYGEEPVAFIISNTNISEIELTSFSKAHLSRFKVPSRFIQVEGFPRNVLGKVERAKLVNLAVGAC